MKACPFCGAESLAATDRKRLACLACGAEGPPATVGGFPSAVDAWNSRHHDSPHTEDFVEAVKLEATHQRERWGSEHDARKAPTDWFWLLGYLGGKAVWAATHGDREKALHHTISTAAVLLNWHAHLHGENTIGPGIETPKWSAP